jgi:hypothetical protein
MVASRRPASTPPESPPGSSPPLGPSPSPRRPARPRPESPLDRLDGDATRAGGRLPAVRPTRPARGPNKLPVASIDLAAARAGAVSPTARAAYRSPRKIEPRPANMAARIGSRLPEPQQRLGPGPPPRRPSLRRGLAPRPGPNEPTADHRTLPGERRAHAKLEKIHPTPPRSSQRRQTMGEGEQVGPTSHPPRPLADHRTLPGERRVHAQSGQRCAPPRLTPRNMLFPRYASATP